MRTQTIRVCYLGISIIIAVVTCDKTAFISSITLLRLSLSCHLIFMVDSRSLIMKACSFITLLMHTVHVSASYIKVGSRFSLLLLWTHCGYFRGFLKGAQKTCWCLTFFFVALLQCFLLLYCRYMLILAQL